MESQKLITVVTPELGNQIEKETQIMEADFMKFSEINSTGSKVLKKNGEHCPRDSEISRDPLSQQLRDIDKELKFNENPFISATHSVACNNSISDAASNSPRELLKGLCASPQVHPSPLKNISNVSNTSDVANKPPYPTWKHLACLLVSSQATPDDCIGCKRPIDMAVDQYELPSKKLVVSSSNKENYPVLAKTGF